MIWKCLRLLLNHICHRKLLLGNSPRSNMVIEGHTVRYELSSRWPGSDPLPHGFGLLTCMSKYLTSVSPDVPTLRQLQGQRRAKRKQQGTEE